LSSSNAGSLVNFAANSKDVFVTYPSSKSVYYDASSNLPVTGALNVTSASATSLAVGLTGATNPAFTVDSSTASQVAGLKVTGAATGGTVAVVATDSGSNTNLTVNAKGTGTIGIGSVSTGAVTITPNTVVTGTLGVGTSAGTGVNLEIDRNLTGAATALAVYANGEIQSGVTTGADGFRSSLSTQATAFTLTSLRHFHATQGTIGAGSTVTSQYGFIADNSLTGATNNYGFYSNIASGTNRFNLYMAGTAENFFGGIVTVPAGTAALPAIISTTGTADTGQFFPAADTVAFSTAGTERFRINSSGNVGIGSAIDQGDVSFTVNKNLTGATSVYGIRSLGTIQSGVTSGARSFQSQLSTVASAFTLTGLRHYSAEQGTFGAGSTVTNQYGFIAENSLTGATNNYGFYSNIASGTGRFNFYAAGTAANFFGGNTVVSVTDDTNAALRITQTGAGDALLVEDSANPDITAFVIDNNGFVAAGSPTTYVTGLAAQGRLAAINNVANTGQGIQVIKYRTSASLGADVELAKSASSTIGTNTLVGATHTIGTIWFTAADGTSFIPAATIVSAVDGTPGLNDMPGRLVFSTTADGASTPTERMRITSAGDVGIGTTSPSTWGKFAVVGASSGGQVVASIVNTSGTANTQAVLSFDTTSNGFNSRDSQIRATNNGSNSTTLEFYTSNGAAPAERMRITSAGDVGIGDTSPSYQLELSTDSAGKPGVGGLWTVVSDERIKSDVVSANLDRCYEIVKSVPLKYFGFADGVYDDNQISDKHNLGWIAQDVQKVFKNAVSVKPFTLKTGEVIDDCLDLNSGQMIAAMYGAVQALMQKIEDQAALIKSLTDRITALESA
jgi:hypothetical protein